MDHSWRPHLPPPPIQGRICPSCSISHFPFCPPPPTPFPSNPSFQYPPPHPHQPLPRPPLPPHESAYDPFIDHRGGPPMPPTHRPAIDGYEHHPRPSDVYGNINPSYDSPGPFNVGVKRMRVDDSPGPFMNEKLTNLARFSTDDERRLKLISEFGAADHEFGGGYGKFDGFLGGKNSTSSYVDQGYGNLDINQTFHDQERFERQQYPPREGNVQFRQLGYDEVDKNLPPRNGYKYGGPQADSYHNVEHDQQNHEGSRYGSELGDGYLPRHGVSGMNKLYHEQTSGLPVDGQSYNHHYSQAYAMQNHVESKSNHYGSPFDQRVNSADRSGMNLYSAQGCKAFPSQPPLPASPPPPLPMEPPLREHLVSSSPPGTSASLFPVSVGSSAPLSSYYPPLPEEKSISHYQPNLHLSSRSAIEEVHMHCYTSSSLRSRGSEHPLLEVPSDKSKVIDASHILKHPYRATRPDHLVVILRGLPGDFSCTVEVQKAIPFLKKAYGDSMHKVLHVGPDTCSVVSKLLEEEDTEAWGIEPYDIEDAGHFCKKLVHKGIVRVADIKFPLPYRAKSFSLVIISDALDYLSPKYLNRTLPELARVSSDGLVILTGYPRHHKAKFAEKSRFGGLAKLRSSTWWVRYFVQTSLEENEVAIKKFEQAASKKSYVPSCQIFHLRSYR